MNNKDWIKFYNERMLQALESDNYELALHNAQIASSYLTKSHQGEVE